MWGKYFFKFLFCLSIIFFSTPYLFALDMGMNVTGGYIATQKDSNAKYFRNKDSDWRSGSNIGANFVLDTIIDKDQLLNYRLGLGYQNVTNVFSRGDTVLYRIMWTNTIGVGIIRQENLRFWIGPQIAMSVDFPDQGKKHTRGGGLIMGYIGPVAGLNITPAKNFSAIFELGGRYGYGASLKNLDHHVNRLEPFVTVGFMYRVL